MQEMQAFVKCLPLVRYKGGRKMKRAISVLMLVLLSASVLAMDFSIRSTDPDIKLNLWSKGDNGRGELKFNVDNVDITAKLKQKQDMGWWLWYEIDYKVQDKNCYLENGTVKDNTNPDMRYLPCKRLPVSRGTTSTYGIFYGDMFYIQNVGPYTVASIPIVNLRE